MTPSIRSVIVDTDAGPDDLIALSYLLCRADVVIEAVTIACGVAYGERGARNVLRLLSLADQSSVPVFVGEQHPLDGGRNFPEAWRERACSLPESLLPEVRDAPQTQEAASFLRTRLGRGLPPVRILALGPLTNLARAGSGPALLEIVAMGGAFGHPGNVAGRTGAEWNFYADPAAADIVCALGVPMMLVTLDAAHRVPLSASLAERIGQALQRPLAGFVSRLIRRLGHEVRAWDPLAAVALTHPEVVKVRRHGVGVRRGVAMRSSGPPLRVAYDADPGLFKSMFAATLTAAAPPPA